MRIALLALALCTGCAHSRNAESLVLQERVADTSGGRLGAAGCPWTSIDSARLERDTLWLNEIPWSVQSPAAGQAFSEILATCGARRAVPQFLAWREAELQAADHRRHATGPSVGVTIGTTLVAGAVTAAGDPQHPERLSNAIQDQNLAPIASAATRPLDEAVEASRAALIEALLHPEPEP